MCRCKVPECEPAPPDHRLTWQPPWLINAIPRTNDAIEKCHRYAVNQLHDNRYGDCPTDLFITNQTITCDEFVFKDDDIELSNTVSVSHRTIRDQI